MALSAQLRDLMILSALSPELAAALPLRPQAARALTVAIFPPLRLAGPEAKALALLFDSSPALRLLLLWVSF